jgi:hypothetical protein
MNDLIIPANHELKTPAVDFRTSGNLKISGESFSSNPVLFFEPVRKWMEDLKNIKPGEIVLTMALEYFNTSSSKMFYGLFKLLETFQNDGLAVKVVWFHEKGDSEMQQTGVDYSSMVKIPFDIKER